jgi:hypothetical protein
VPREPSSGIVRVDVEYLAKAKEFSVVVWGRCHPHPCEWGGTYAQPFWLHGRLRKNADPIEATGFSARYERSWVTVTLEGWLQGKLLAVFAKSVFAANDPRANLYSLEYFVRRG